MTATCTCGLQCTPIDVDGQRQWYCSNCNRILKGTEVLAGQVPFNYTCEQCGSPMSSACRAVCPNCCWQKSCE